MPDCVCDPTFPTSVPDGETCPSCFTYHAYSGAIALLGLLYVGRVTKQHWKLPGGSYRNYAFGFGLLFLVLRIIRYPLAAAFLQLDIDFDVVPALVWAELYILPTVSLAAGTLVLSTNWRVVQRRMAFSDDFDAVAAHSRAEVTVRIAKTWVALLFIVEAGIYIVASSTWLTPELRSQLSNVASPIVIGTFILGSGILGNIAGRGLRRILAASNHRVSTMLPERMTTLVLRYSIACFVGGGVSILGGVSALVSEEGSTNDWLVRSYAFRTVELLACVSLVVVYKLPQQALRESLEELKNAGKPRPGMKSLSSARSGSAVMASPANDMDLEADTPSSGADEGDSDAV